MAVQNFENFQSLAVFRAFWGIVSWVKISGKIKKVRQKYSDIQLDGEDSWACDARKFSEIESYYQL